MTDGERLYARAAASAWREKIEHLAEGHHVTLRQEALAALRAALDVLYADGADDLDVANFVAEFTSAPPSIERTIS